MCLTPATDFEQRQLIRSFMPADCCKYSFKTAVFAPSHSAVLRLSCIGLLTLDTAKSLPRLRGRASLGVAATGGLSCLQVPDGPYLTRRGMESLHRDNHGVSSHAHSQYTLNLRAAARCWCAAARFRSRAAWLAAVSAEALEEAMQQTLLWSTAGIAARFWFTA